MKQVNMASKAPSTKAMQAMASNLKEKFNENASVDIICQTWKGPRYKIYIAGNKRNFWNLSSWRTLLATYRKLMKEGRG